MARTSVFVVSLVGAIAALVAPASAQAPVGLTLGQALAEALARNPVLAVERNEVGIAAGALRQARVYPFNPELGLEGGAGRGQLRDDGASREINRTSIGLSQSIPIRGQWGLRIRSAEAGLNRADAFVKDVERQVTGDVLRTFSDVLVGQERVALAREIVALTAEVRDAAGKLLEAGAVPQLDVLRANVELERARNRLVTEERNLATAQRELALLLGRDAAQPIRGEGALTFPVPSGELAALQKDALEHRPDLSAARAAVRAAAAELGIVQAERVFPEVRVGVRYDEAREFETLNRSGVLTLSVPLPLFNRRQGDTDRAAGELRRQEAQVALVERRIEKEVTSTWQRVGASAQVTDAYVGRILPEQDRNFRLLREGYNLGEFRITDVFVGQREFIDAREAWLSAVAELNAAIAELYRAINRRP
jgi:cobalt-zinc-cadmium efflux system outer membrane protein